MTVRWHPLEITLTPDQVMLDNQIGWRRHSSRIAAGSVHKNGRPRNDVVDLANHQAAVRAEHAGHLAMQTRYWFMDGDILGKPKQADLDYFIDVKRREASRHRLLVQFDDPKHWAYLTVCGAKDPTLMVGGWCFGHELLPRHRAEPVRGRPCYAVEMDDTVLKDPRELIQLAAKIREQLYDTRRAC